MRVGRAALRPKVTPQHMSTQAAVVCGWQRGLRWGREPGRSGWRGRPGRLGLLDAGELLYEANAELQGGGTQAWGGGRRQGGRVGAGPGRVQGRRCADVAPVKKHAHLS